MEEVLFLSGRETESWTETEAAGDSVTPRSQNWRRSGDQVERRFRRDEGGRRIQGFPLPIWGNFGNERERPMELGVLVLGHFYFVLMGLFN